MLAFLALALLAGGSSSHPLSAGIVRLASLPILGVALWRLRGDPASPAARWPSLVLIACAVLVLAQLAPLPPAAWSLLPGRATVLEGYAAAGIAPPWLPLSLTPNSTWDAGLGLLAPAAMFCAVLTLGEAARRRLVLVVLAIAVAGIGLGVLQMLGGPDSALRPYAITNRGAAVGFFANRNHQASLLLACLPLAALLAAPVRRSRSQARFWMAVASMIAVILAIGVGITQSRAAAVLFAPALLGSLLVAARGWIGTRAGARAPLLIGLAAAMLGGGALVVAFTPLADQFQASPETELRMQLYPRVAAAGLDYFPAGSGMGSFDTVYRTLEEPQEVSGEYVNHAHNDYLEIWLEAGLAGSALVAAFLAWWCFAAGRVLKGAQASGGLAVAGCVMSGVLLAHSLADYPLRTPALACLFALACGLMTPAPGQKAARRQAGSSGR